MGGLIPQIADIGISHINNNPHNNNMKLEITSTVKGNKTQLVCTADGVEIGKRCSARKYVKCFVVKQSKSFNLSWARSRQTWNLSEAAKYGRGADCKTLEEFVRVFGNFEAPCFKYVLDGSYSKWSAEHAESAVKLQTRIEEIESGAADAEFEKLFVFSWHMRSTAKPNLRDRNNLVLVSEVYA